MDAKDDPDGSHLNFQWRSCGNEIRESMTRFSITTEDLVHQPKLTQCSN